LFGGNAEWPKTTFGSPKFRLEVNKVKAVHIALADDHQVPTISLIGVGQTEILAHF
jgi:hypothetical protein